jgi:hypothetical protein
MILSQNKFHTLLFLKDFNGGTPISHVDVVFFPVAEEEEEEEEEECAGW